MRTTLLLFTAALAAGSWAGESLTTSTVGRGKCEIRGGKDFDIRRVTLQLYRDNHFRLFLDTESVRSVSGTYRAQGGRRYQLNIDYAFDRSDSRGSGYVQLESGNDITSLSISGKSGDASFNASFRSDDDSFGGSGGSWNQNNNTGPSRGSSTGRGQLSYQGDNDRLSSLTASYMANGRVLLTFGGEAKFSMEAEQSSGSRLRVVSINGTPSSGSGTGTNLTTDRAVVNVTGTYKGSRISISYRAEEDNGREPGPWNPGSQGGFGKETYRGSGILNYRGDRDSLNVLTAELNGNGTFQISIAGDAKGTFKGTWTSRGGTYSLNLKTLDGNDIDGRGTLRRERGRDFMEVSLNGRYRGSNILMNFRSR
jgi:hypothetical protein